MLPGMAAKPRITLVGAGNLASALAVAVRRAGYAIDAVVARPIRSSLSKARKLAEEVGARVLSTSSGQLGSDVVWFCVPDSQIADAAHSLVDRIDSKNGHSKNWRGKIALHSSGALDSDVLAELRSRGAAVASVHPLMTFVRDSRPSLAGVSFAVEGDAQAIRVARQIVQDLRGHSCSIRKQDKAAYHACGTFASPLLCALLATTEEAAVAAGMNRKSARERLLPILQQTIANYGRLGAAASFSGPIVRGDVATVEQHLQQLRALPVAREVYIALANSALKSLPVKNRPRLEAILRRKWRAERHPARTIAK